MKKLFTLCVATLSVVALSAQTRLNNPVGADGRYIVKWDCATNDWAASNDFEPGETVTIAVDVTGTMWEDGLKTPSPAGNTRGIAAHIWFAFGDYDAIDKKPETERLDQIDGNIWGATYNFAQALEVMNPAYKTALLENDAVLYAYCMLHFFDIKSDGTAGDEWWSNATATDNPGEGPFFASAPSTGKTSTALKGSLYGLDAQAGYAPACEGTTAVSNVEATAAAATKSIENGQLVILSNGVKYNAQGVVVE